MNSHNVLIIIGVIGLSVGFVGFSFLFFSESSESFANRQIDRFYRCSEICYIYAGDKEIKDCMVVNCVDIFEDLLIYYGWDEYQMISNLNQKNKQILRCMNNCEDSFSGDDRQMIRCLDDCL